MPSFKSRLVLLLALSGLPGCSTRYIQNTDVEDTSFNRDVIEFCEEYRHAVERRAIGAMLKMAHPDYYEDGGNVDASDDIDYAGLREFLETKFRDTLAIRYEIRYRDVERQKDGKVFVIYTYSASYRVPTERGEVWRRQVADNRLELVEVDGDWKILAGM